MTLLENNFGKVRCKTCDSVMIPDKEDVKYSYDDGHFVICPVCGERIWFNDEDYRNPVCAHILKGGIPHK
jgi:YgiT-type zinc finger domain-containing protein